MPARSSRLVAILAGVLGLVGILCCGVAPLLPVTQQTATVLWPQGADADGFVSDITAPLVSGAPKSLDVTIPCTAVASLPADGGVVFSTIPANGIDAGRNGLFVRANADVVYVAFRDTVAAVAPRQDVDRGACSALRLWANVGAVGADFVGIPGATGTLGVDKRPQVAGVFTDLRVPVQSGVNARIDVDTRFITTPSALKTLVMALGVICVAGSIIALALLDRASGRRPARARRRVGWATWVADLGVIGGLLVWHIVGATSSDDGYNLTMARVAGEAGYSTNYYRYFGASEAPFDWYQSVLAHLASISTAGVWMRLPALLAGIGTWLIVSRCLLPRLGRRVAANRVATWTAAAVFLAAWLPFNNGLRPEPLIAFAVVAVLMLVEWTLGTRRLWPAAVAIVVAMFSVTLAPQGLVALAPLLVGARGITSIVSARRRTDGFAATLLPLVAAFSLISVIVFRDQTLATVAESVRIKYVVGPTIPWYQEFLRYYYLTVEDSVDGSLTRRFAVLVLLLCVFGLFVVLLRRGRVPGAVSGPVWRLTGSAAVGLLLLHLTPTKWAVQFGAFAGLAAALGAVTAFAFARVGLHSRRNLALYVTALLFVLAWATSGINGWFYVGNYGVPWFDKQPVIAHFPVTTIFLVLAIACGLLSAWLHFRIDYAGHTQVADTGRNRALASTPLLVVAVIMVVLELGSMLKATAGRYPVYTTGSANIAALRSGLSTDSCAMADDVLVEADTNAGMLTPVPGQRWGQYGPLGGEDPVGFTPNGVSDTLEPAEPVAANPGTVNSDGPVDKPNIGIGYAAGTGGGYGPEGVNGSRVFLPFGLDPKRTPVMGSYGENAVAAKATSAWYQLPPRTPDRPLVSVAAAGAIWYYNEDGSFNYGQSLKLQWGVHRPDGSYQALGEVQPIDIFQQKAWRNLRFPLTTAPPEANVARIVADDPNLSEDQWFGFTPPRVPVLQTAEQFLGSDTPVMMDIATAANFPCQRPFAEHLGIAELPQYRIIPNFKQMVVSSNQWQSAESGGPFLFIQALLRTATIPTYLNGDWYRDWGSLERYIRVVPRDEAPDAVVEEGSTRVFGWSRGGPIRGSAVNGVNGSMDVAVNDVKVARWVATIAGLLGFVLAVATPLLPVTQTTATLNWPQQGRVDNVTAPLIAQAPVTLTASIPCTVLADMPAKGGLALGTAPAQGRDAALNAMLVNVTASRVDVIVRNVVVASVNRNRIGGCERLAITSSHDGTFAEFVGLKKSDGSAQRTGYADPNLRPAIVGVFTDLVGPAPPGLQFSATIDTRYTTHPSALKLTAMLLAMVSTVIALLALWRLDRLDGRRMHRVIPTRWRTFSVVDVVVVGGFLLWYVIGAGSSDDGYQMQMARTADHAGYMANYFRWFGSPEDPFGWYYNVLALMTHVSDASLWIRLPDLICSMICWLPLSREVLPRLGPAVSSSRAAMWAAGLVLLAAWMPFNNGLRPEGQIATGALVTYVLIERAITSGRLTPAALATLTAAFTLGIQPTGLIAVAALVAGGRPILRIVMRRRALVGTWPLIAPLLAAGTVILTVVFADQTIATVLEATKIRTAIGPSQEWYTENLRYYYLILPTTDGAIERRVAFLFTAMCLFPSLFMMLRRKRVPGVARGPAWRLMGVIFATIFFLMFTPTKWIHHFGLFAAVGGAMAALATVMVSPVVLRSARNRMAFLSLVFFVLALCFASTNGWWYVSNFGVPFNNSVPKIGGVTVSTMFFALFAVAALWAFWLHLRPRREPRVVRLLTAAPIPIAAGLMVVVSVASMAIGVARQYPTYSNGWANVRALAGGCGLADDVLVEPDSNAGFLAPLPGDYGPLGPLGGATPTGFSPNGVPEKIIAEAIRLNNPQPGTDYDWNRPIKLSRPGLNGSTVPLPYGLDPARVPVAGSYSTAAQQESRLTSAWYALPAPDDAHPLVVITAAGTIEGTSVANGLTSGQKVELEYATRGPDGAPVPAGRVQPYDIGPTPSWRNLRYPRSEIPADAVAVRVVAEDLSLGQGDWVAVTPPRVPEVRSVQEYVGSTQPVLMDWAVGLVFPCQQPMLHANGVTDIPKFRISPDYFAKLQSTDTWQDGKNGGLLGITDLLLRASVMSTYLSHDWGQDWGSLRRFDTIVDAQPAQIDLGEASRSGLWSPGPMRIEP